MAKRTQETVLPQLSAAEAGASGSAAPQRGEASVESTATVAEQVAIRIRENVIRGAFRPGQHLSEAALSESLNVSRNTLREVFSKLTTERLLHHEPNRGVFVASPSMAAIVDLYHARRMIECAALAEAHPMHPAVARMRQAVLEARRLREAENWVGVGNADIQYHSAIVDLADSFRLSTFFSQIAAEMRLAFLLLEDPEFLHSPFIDKNSEILSQLEAGKTKEAAANLEHYLVQAERIVLVTFSRASEGGRP